MDNPKVLAMVQPFDPMSSEAEDHYDAVVRRLNRVRARRTRVAEEYARLETQFVEGDLVVVSGPRKGEPLSKQGRRRRLGRLVKIGAEVERLDEEERFSVAALERMNEALDRWARETYAP